MKHKNWIKPTALKELEEHGHRWMYKAVQKYQTKSQINQNAHKIEFIQI